MQITRFTMVTLASILILIEIISLCQGITLLGNYTILSSGIIDYSPRPLHTEGRYVKNDLGKTVLLYGVWTGGFLDSCVGWLGESPTNWDEEACRKAMQTLRIVWKVKVVCVFFWAKWWIDDASTILGGGATTDRSYKYCIKRTIEIAGENGLYVQLRMWGSDSAHGRKEQPIPPWDNSGVFSNISDFANFWADMTYELRDYQNVIYTLYDEPTGDINIWFDAATAAINAIRAKGIDNLVVVHWAYCGGCWWMEDWIQQNRTTYNILFSNHIYRYHGTFENNPNSPTDIDYIRTILADNDWIHSHRGYEYIIDMYDIPIWVSAMGAYNGGTNDDEYEYIKNTFQILNEWNISYVLYRFETYNRGPSVWSTQNYTGSPPYPPNRVGLAFINGTQ